MNVRTFLWSFIIAPILPLLVYAGPRKKPALSDEHRLTKDLFNNYDFTVRPRYNALETVQVKVRFSLQQINDLDEKRQILKMSGWLTAEWKDEFLVWNASDYGGLTSLVLDPRRMWVPKLAIGNSANRLFDSDHYKRFWITVRNNGEARWQPGGVFAIACALDMNFYPFDDQKCTMEIETWVYTADKVNLTSSLDYVGLDTYIQHGEWEILKTDVKGINMIYKYYQDESFPEVYFTIYIRRKYTFYFMYILLPCLMLSGVLLTIFMLPADSGEKVSLGVSILVSISVFLLLVASNVPDTSDAIPIIAIYLTYFMMATTLSVAASVLVIKMHFQSADNKPPRWLRFIVFNVMTKVMRMDNPDYKYKKRLMTKSNAICRSRASWREANENDSKHANRNNSFALQEEVEVELLNKKPSHVVENSHVEAMNQTPERSKLKSCSCSEGEEPPPRNEWKEVAEIVDRFFFWLFLFFIIVPTACILGFVRLFKPVL